MYAALTTLVLLGAAASPPAAPAPAARQPPGFLRQLAQTGHFNFGRPVAPTITPDERAVYFLRGQPDGNQLSLHVFDVATGQSREVLTPARVLAGAEEQLSAQERARRERMRISARGFTSYALSEDGARLLLTLAGRLYVVETASGRVTELKAGPGAIAPRLSLDGQHVAYVREHDVYRLELATNTEHRVTTGGTEELSHGLAEFVAQEEMGRFTGFWWSPDAQHLAYTEVDTRGMEKLTLVDPLQPQAGAQQLAYPFAGKPNAKVRLGITSARGGPTVWVKWDAEAYPYVATVDWPAKGALTLLVQNRRQTEELLLAVDPLTGETRPLLTERDAAWVALDQSFPRWLEDGSGFLWYTERNGGPEVELRRANGRLLRSVVGPEAGFQALAGEPLAGDRLFFVGGPNPTERYLWRVASGGKPTRVTTGGPALETARVSRRGGLIVLSTEGPDSLRRTRVLRSDGTVVGELPSVARTPDFVPRLEVRQVGAERFWTSLVRPRNAKPGVKLPVIVSVYGAAWPMVRQSMAANLISQWMADHGFLVVSLDGRGTAGRGRAWEKQLKHDFSGLILDDQVSALRALAAQVPELDLTRVGITGWSMGGYVSALAVLKRPDVFKAAVAGAPVVDWRDYDTHATERYLGLPDEKPEVYTRNSLLSYVSAERPMGKLLLVHGTADDNVFFLHSLKLTDALLRAGKPHDFLPLPGATHMVADPAVDERLHERMMLHFRESL